MTTDQDQRQGAEGADRPSPLTNPKVLLGAGLSALFVVFVLSNLEEVEIDFLWFGFTTNLIWALLASAVVGAVAMWGFGSLRARGARKRQELLAKAQLDKKK